MLVGCSGLRKFWANLESIGLDISGRSLSNLRCLKTCCQSRRIDASWRCEHSLVGSTKTNTSIRVMALQFFWLVATIYVLLLIGFVLRIRTGGTAKFKADRVDTLARSQRKDTWVACAVIWAVLLSNGCPIRWLFCVAGAALLTWLLQRTVRRFRSLQ